VQVATVREVFEVMKSRVESNPAKISGLTAAYQFELTGDGGGTFHAVFDQGASDIGEGPAANPGCTVTMAAPDFLAMVGGQLNPTAAFMGGKLKLKGDMGLAMKLQSLIS
jgi:putative sterol carrier protein